MDRFAEKIFRNRIFDKEKLLKFGFQEKNNKLIYSTKISNGQFELEICIKDKKEIKTKLVDCASKDEYTLHLVEGIEGKFVGEIRDEYEKVLNKIADKCCITTYFSSLQTNRLAEWIKQKYNGTPEFLWEKFPGHAVFRNQYTEKWYGLIANIDAAKIDTARKGKIEVLNIKIDKDEIQILLKQRGFYPAYHMNKKSWISVILDETVSDEKIQHLLDESYDLSQGKNHLKTHEWIVPCNPKFYDIDDAFSKHKEILWKQSNNSIKPKDTVYLYVASPISAIRYKCEVTDVNIPYNYEDKNLKINKVMKIKLLKEYPCNFLTLNILKSFGMNAVRGQRHLPADLSNMINKKDNL